MSDSPVDWRRWNACAYLKTWEAVALSINRDPETIRHNEWVGGKSMTVWETNDEFDARLSLLRRGIEADREGLCVRGDIDGASRDSGKGCRLQPEAVRRFFMERGYTVPAEWSESTQQASSGPSAPWPWGDYETSLLRHLDAAARQWWVNYNPDDPTTAHTNREVSDSLQKRGVPKRVAEVMAQMLRADGLPVGRRKA